MSDKRPTAGEQSTMGLYLRELRRIPQLSREEEQAFAARAAQGDQEARQHLIQANLRFVILVAKRYRNRGVPLEDLVNEGNIGLIRAAERFDPDRGVRFVSYAVWWIRQAILKAIHEDGRLIRVPRSRAEELSRIEELRRDRGCRAAASRAFSRSPNPDGRRSESAMLVQAAQKTLSLDSPVRARRIPIPWAPAWRTGTFQSRRRSWSAYPCRSMLDSVLAGLSDREACILRRPLRACRQQTHHTAGGRPGPGPATRRKRCSGWSAPGATRRRNS